MKLVLKLNVNGQSVEVLASPMTSLAQVLKEELEINSVKRGCDSGGCGMCTVLLNGKGVYSCMMPSWRAEDEEILTVEGLSPGIGTTLHPLQEAFIRNFAPQCGYCTPAMLLAAASLLASNSNPTDVEIKDSLCGVICRCTGYFPYVKSVRDVAARGNIGKTSL